jgi:hypothetical protein
VTTDFVFINVTVQDNLSNVASATLDWNGTNFTMSGSGDNFYLNQTNLSNGNYTYRVYANDTAGNLNVSETRLVIVNFTAPKWINVTLLYPNDEEHNVVRYRTFRVNASVTCEGASGDCGVVNATARYNTTSQSDTVISTSAGATPYYVVAGSQPQTCNGGAPLNVGETCVVNWTVNATGSGVWVLDVNFSTSTGLTNDTEDVYKNAGAAVVYSKVLPKDWVLFSWPYEEKPVADALTSLGANYAAVYYWNGTDYEVYDPAFPSTSDFQTLLPHRAYWLNMTSTDDLNISGATQSFNMSLSTGWNTFSWPYNQTNTSTALASIDGSWDFILGWDANSQDWIWKSSPSTRYVPGTMDTLDPATGYWIYMNSAAVYTYTPP